MKRDLVVVVPVLIAGAFALDGLDAAVRRPDLSVAPYLAFLALMASALLLWYRMKVQSAERLRVIELGRDRPRDPRPAPGPNPTAAAVAMGVVGPVGVSLFAWLTSLTTEGDPGLIWGIAGLIGVTSLICGTILLARLHPTPYAGPTAADDDQRWSAAAKPPVHDPDAFDLVGRRG